ncbi:hypothetical protein M407DRAFT_28695 [Tulasnella calospora MUT 4182]|uniref:Uncharacterized protein n=1 Tax=Tulasnella calospora MUT 4182 TaxID=1051891 RepID=A0A0C3LK89_9AGAM|nr:hypothetical protein M407DRAFT_28695 [Tulasnella calospora MUT 4182]
MADSSAVSWADAMVASGVTVWRKGVEWSSVVSQYVLESDKRGAVTCLCLIWACQQAPIVSPLLIVCNPGLPNKYNAVDARLTAKELEKGEEQTGYKQQEGLLLDIKFCASTKTMTLTGDKYTLRWAVPEVINGDAPGLWSDIWALGWVGYKVMMNSIPFEDVSDGMVVMSVIQGDVPAGTLIPLGDLQPRTFEPQLSMITPNRARTADTADVADRSPGLLMQLGQMHRDHNDYPNASKYYTEALAVYTDIADGQGKADALAGLANIHRLRDESNQAVAAYSEYLQIRSDIGDRTGRASALWGLAEMHRVRDEYEQALVLYSECLQIWSDIGDRQGRASGLFSLALVYQAQGEYNQAIALYSEDQHRRQKGDSRGSLWSR